ncbi:hypothetical protein PAPYR_9360 [Paratrimastix pyriformis]|uniref:Uncharacterized protein n=1 Tax=Paratrimastix pyriformis TaxID=342808 RepID=A0ABQ8UDD7_9EUKA|nr:hypothetical protein PAPYR_9360 [Paratrimastix pyriformis]
MSVVAPAAQALGINDISLELMIRQCVFMHRSACQTIARYVSSHGGCAVRVTPPWFLELMDNVQRLLHSKIREHHETRERLENGLEMLQLTTDHVLQLECHLEQLIPELEATKAELKQLMADLELQTEELNQMKNDWT